MKTAERIKANSFEQTINQVPNEWGVEVPETIAASCKDYYHVLLIQRTNDPALERYTTTASVQQFPKDSWVSRKGGIKDTLPLLGYKHAFILHDPTKPEVKKPAGRPKKKVAEEGSED